MKAEQVFPPADTIAVVRIVVADGLPLGEWPYPGPGCGESEACTRCPRWRCPGCELLRPWCFGCDGDRPALCDDCWFALDTKGEAGGGANG